MSNKPLGEKVGQWLRNAKDAKTLITVITTISLSSIYGNSDTVKGWVHSTDEPQITVNVDIPKAELVNHDIIFNELFELNKKQDARMMDMQTQIDKNTEWLK